MTRHLLDTNIISNVTTSAPSATLVAWLAAQADETLFIAALTVAEIWRGVLEKPAGKMRRDLERWFSGPEGPSAQPARHDHRGCRRVERLHPGNRQQERLR